MNAMQYSEISANSTLSFPTRNICQSGDVPCTPLVSTRPLGYSVTYILMPHRQVIKVSVQKFYNLIFLPVWLELCLWLVCVSVDVGCESCASAALECNPLATLSHLGSHIFSHLTAGDRSLSHLTISINKITSHPSQ